MSYQPIENYGIIGDLNTIALVGLNGSIDFLCLPDFDSPSVFASLLDEDEGGYFSIHPKPKDGVKYKQLYFPDSNILLTRFLLKEGVGELTDLMPISESSHERKILRRVTCVRGALSFVLECVPKFNYSQSKHEIEILNDHEVLFKSVDDKKVFLLLQCSVPLRVNNEQGAAFADFELKLGEKADIILTYFEKENKHKKSKVSTYHEYIDESISETLNYWKHWIDTSTYHGRWIEVVNRSALVLKLLTSRKYGSMVAAPTFSLPEHIGGERNWDYRYTWIRDSSFTVHVLIKLGFRKEAHAFMNWVEKECEGVGNAGNLGLMYKLDGDTQVHEEEVKSLDGYKGSKPVRIGNRAYKQFQLDIYGELMDAVYLYNHHVQFISLDFWNALKKHIDWLCDHWMDKDNGIWEVRAERKHYLYSKLMCWVAFDRAVRIAQSRSLPITDRWGNERNKVHEYILSHFWNEEKKSFVQLTNDGLLDASLLLMPIVGFISPQDPKWLSTLANIEAELVSDCLVYRYRHEKFNDGFKQGEGTFNMCSFWYIECLSKSGQVEKARFYFEKMLGYSNHLGLYSEELGAQGELLGNFPQAFSHLALISAAHDLNIRLDQMKK